MGELKILVVEDDLLLARAIARCMASSGMEPAVVTSGAAALACIGHYEVGVFDMDLGDANGTEVAKRLLMQKTVRHAVFFTATADIPAMGSASRLGPVVQKREGVQALQRAVAEISQIR